MSYEIYLYLQDQPAAKKSWLGASIVAISPFLALGMAFMQPERTETMTNKTNKTYQGPTGEILLALQRDFHASAEALLKERLVERLAEVLQGKGAAVTCTVYRGKLDLFGYDGDDWAAVHSELEHVYDTLAELANKYHVRMPSGWHARGTDE